MVGTVRPSWSSARHGEHSGNGPHNPFVDQRATYTLDINGLIASDTISNLVFPFGTS